MTVRNNVSRPYWAPLEGIAVWKYTKWVLENHFCILTTYITHNSKEMYSKERETERQRQTHTHRDTEREDSHIIVHHLNIKPFDDWFKPKFSYYKSTAHTCTVNCAALHRVDLFPLFQQNPKMSSSQYFQECVIWSKIIYPCCRCKCFVSAYLILCVFTDSSVKSVAHAASSVLSSRAVLLSFCRKSHQGN